MRKTAKKPPVVGAMETALTSSSKRYTFVFNLGDLSGDGHNKREQFVASAVVPIEDVRKAYFAAKKKLGEDLCPECFMNEFEDREVSIEVLQAIEKAGGPPLFHNEEDGDTDTALLADYVIWFINQGGDVCAKLEEDSLPSLQCADSDDRDKQIRSIGYGLFYSF